MKRALWTILLLSELSPEALLADTYIVKKNDTLSAIAASVRGGPVYGRKGSLREILDLNQGIKDPDYILPGDIIEVIAHDLAPPQDTAKAAPVALFFRPFVAFYRIDSEEKETGSKASTLSNLGYGAELGWEYKLDKELLLQISASIAKYHFMVSQNKSLTSPDLTRGEIVLGVYKLNNWSRIGAQVAYGQEFLLVAKNLSDLAIEKIQLAKLQATYDYFLVRQDEVSVMIGAMVGGSSPSETQEFQTDLGYTYGLNSSFAYETSFGRIENFLSYRHLSLQTQSLEEKIQETSFKTNFTIDL